VAEYYYLMKAGFSSYRHRMLMAALQLQCATPAYRTGRQRSFIVPLQPGS